MYIYDSNYNVNGFIDSKNCKDYNLVLIILNRIQEKVIFNY